MRRKRQYQPTFGSISHGTMRPEDLIPEFADELDRCIYRRHGYKQQRKLVDEARRLKDYDSDDAYEIIDELFDALNEFAPAYGYFGAHPGDGADYGYWLHEDWESIVIEDAIKVDDLSDVPEDYRGEVLVVNDHGNASLYVKTARKLIPVWSIV